MGVLSGYAPRIFIPPLPAPLYYHKRERIASLFFAILQIFFTEPSVDPKCRSLRPTATGSKEKPAVSGSLSLPLRGSVDHGHPLLWSRATRHASVAAPRRFNFCDCEPPRPARSRSPIPSGSSPFCSYCITGHPPCQGLFLWGFAGLSAGSSPAPISTSELRSQWRYLHRGKSLKATSRTWAPCMVCTSWVSTTGSMSQL